MDYIKIDKLVTTSIYKQIAESITKAIKSGLLKYNDKLPTEKELCESFAISNTAVKMAYEKLISEALIKRIKGKGTYVTNRLSYHTDLHSFYEFDVNNEKLKTEVLLFDRIFKEYGAYRALKLETGEKCYKLNCLTKQGKNPVVLRKIYLPEKYYPDFLQTYKEFTTVFDYIEKVNSYKIKHQHNAFSTINASSAEAQLLNINNDDAIYYIRSIVTDDRDEIIAYICHYFPGEFTEFEVVVNAI